MKRLSLLLVLSTLLFGSCSAFCPQENWSTVPRTNNPNAIIDVNQGSTLGAPEY